MQNALQKWLLAETTLRVNRESQRKGNFKCQPKKWTVAQKGQLFSISVLKAFSDLLKYPAKPPEMLASCIYTAVSVYTCCSRVSVC